MSYRSEPLIIAASWSDAHHQLSHDVGDLYQIAVARSALAVGRARGSGLTFDQEEGLFIAAQHAAGGGRVAGWPKRLPRLRCRVRIMSAERRAPQDLFMDPNRDGLGLSVFLRRLGDHLERLPVPFAGRVVVSLDVAGSGPALGSIAAVVEVGTLAKPGDPSVRKALDAALARERQYKRTMNKTMAFASEQMQKNSLAMRQMFGESANVIQAIAVLMDELRQAGLVPAPKDQGGDQVAVFLQQMLGLFTKQGGLAAGASCAEPEHLGDPASRGPFDAWQADIGDEDEHSDGQDWEPSYDPWPEDEE